MYEGFPKLHSSSHSLRCSRSPTRTTTAPTNMTAQLESRNNDIEDTVTSAIIELETQAREKAQAFREVDSITDDLDVLEVKLAKAKKVVSREKKR